MSDWKKEGEDLNSEKGHDNAKDIFDGIEDGLPQFQMGGSICDLPMEKDNNESNKAINIDAFLSILPSSYTQIKKDEIRELLNKKTFKKAGRATITSIYDRSEFWDKAKKVPNIKYLKSGISPAGFVVVYSIAEIRLITDEIEKKLRRANDARLKRMALITVEGILYRFSLLHIGFSQFEEDTASNAEEFMMLAAFCFKINSILNSYRKSHPKFEKIKQEAIGCFKETLLKGIREDYPSAIIGPRSLDFFYKEFDKIEKNTTENISAPQGEPESQDGLLNDNERKDPTKLKEEFLLQAQKHSQSMPSLDASEEERQAWHAKEKQYRKVVDDIQTRPKSVPLLPEPDTTGATYDLYDPDRGVHPYDFLKDHHIWSKMLQHFNPDAKAKGRDYLFQVELNALDANLMKALRDKRGSIKTKTGEKLSSILPAKTQRTTYKIEAMSPENQREAQSIARTKWLREQGEPK